MAKSKDLNKEKTVSSFMKLLQKEVGAESFNKSKLTKITDWISTGSLGLDRIISGSCLHGGIPAGCISLISGDSSTMKTLVAFIIAKNAIEKNHYDAIIYVDAEGGANRGMLDTVGIDQDLVQYVPVLNVEDATIKLLNIYKTISEHQKTEPDFQALILLDSLGGLVSEKVLLDANNDKNVNDMGTTAKKCVAPDTLILMADGSYKEIKNVNIGENVITHLNKVLPVKDKFTTKHKSYYKIKIGGKEIKCSTNHRFLVKRNNEYQYVEAKDLTTDDKIMSLIES